MKYAVVFALSAALAALMWLSPAFAAGAGQSAAGTGREQAALPPPVELPAECFCAECGMNVRPEDLSFASEMIFSDGEVRYFCDLGDMMVFYDVLKDKGGVAAIYVRDHISKNWIDARSSFYLTEADVTSPMRFGYLAFSEMGKAQGYRLEHGGGGIYSFDQIISSRIFRR